MACGSCGLSAQKKREAQKQRNQAAKLLSSSASCSKGQCSIGSVSASVQPKSLRLRFVKKPLASALKKQTPVIDFSSFSSPSGTVTQEAAEQYFLEHALELLEDVSP